MSDSNERAKRQRITKRVVDALEPGETVWDGEVTGFGVRRQRRDASFVLKYSFRGRQRFLTIARHGVFTVDTARTEARRLLGLIASGIDPAVIRDQVPSAQEALTVEDLCLAYLEKGPSYKPDKKQSSWYTDASNIKRHIVPLIGGVAASELSESRVVKFMADVVAGATECDERVGHRARAIVKGGKGVAARALAVLGAVYSFGMRTGAVAHNPTKEVKPPKGETPGRFLTKDEWARLGEAITAASSGGETPAFVDAILLLAMTGCRRSEVTGLQWSEVDLDRGLLRLQSSKAGPRAVPLGDHAIEILARRKKAAAKGAQFVFPSARGSGPIVGIQKFWSSLREKADLADVRLHDLRHSFASQAVNAGASLYLTGAILGHRQASTTQRYAHLQSGPVRELASSVGKGITEAMRSRRRRKGEPPEG